MNQVEEFLLKQGYIEPHNPTDEELIRKTLATLQQLVQQYAELVCGEVPVTCVIQPYGSYRMGVRTKSGDIDCCILACHHHHTNQEETFSLAKLALYLEKNTDIFSKIRAVVDAINPILKLTTTNNIDIDLCVVHIRPVQPKLFQQIATQMVTNSYINNPEAKFWYTFLFEKLTKTDGFVVFNQFKDLNLLNGCRDAEYFLEIIPNHEQFYYFSHLITYWAKQRCIYNHTLGYIGGYSWRLLLIHTLVNEKVESVPAFLKRFFTSLERNENVIALSNESREQFCKHIERKTQKQIDQGFVQAGKTLLLITPTPTYQNSARNVIKSTLMRIQNEMKRASELVDNLEELCKPFPFFTSFSNYLRIDMDSNQQSYFEKWKGYVSSRLVGLFERFEQIHKNVELSPCTREFANELSVGIYLGITVDGVDQQEKQKIGIEMQNVINKFIQDVYEQIELVEVKKRNKAIIQKEELERSFNLSIKFIKNSKLPKD